MCLLIVPVLFFVLGGWLYADWWLVQLLARSAGLSMSGAAWFVGLGQLAILLAAVILIRAWREGKRRQPVVTVGLAAAVSGALTGAAQPLTVALAGAAAAALVVAAGCVWFTRSLRASP